MRKGNQKLVDRLLLKKACHEACGESLSIIFQKYREPVCDYLRKIGVDGLAEDVCQILFLQILGGCCNYDGKGDVRNYLFGIARNIHKRDLRSSKRTVYARNWRLIMGDKGVEACPATALEISETTHISQIRTGELPSKSRKAIELVYQKGIPAKEAAKIAGCDFKAFRDQLDYGLQCLRKKMKDA